LQRELASTKPSLVLAGSSGAVGTTIKPAEPITGFDGIASTAALLGAVERMNGGQVQIAFVRGTNPAYYLPKTAKFAEAFSKVKFKVSFSSFPDETTELCDLVIPDLHSLESWGDAEPVRGTIGLQQPAMDPVFPNLVKTLPAALGTGDVLIQVAKKDAAQAARYAGADYRAWLFANFPGGAAAFTAGLPKALVAGSLPARGAAPAAATIAKAAPASGTQGDLFLITYPSPLLGDGRGANKPWLQELPDPVTKVTWSSWVEIHP
jgi:molybdopterin-containing oxidoreductase family iron-sulfur binding subunit